MPSAIWRDGSVYLEPRQIDQLPSQMYPTVVSKGEEKIGKHALVVKASAPKVFTFY